MIISHKYKYIFLKTSKTAGTSIEIALSKYCGEKDIITPIMKEDEVIRQNLGYKGPQNYLEQDRITARYYNHISAAEIIPRIGEEVWNSYYKFCFERNPFERVISQYFFLCRTEPRPSIMDFVQSGAPLLLHKRGYKLYTIDKETVVNRICLYENLEDDLDSVRALVNLPGPLELPHAKTSHRIDKRSFKQILSKTEQALIREMFSIEFSLFGY
jgi:hypothetical protein